ncbi:hypothetical protein [Leptolyngbya iicbica]|uniref:Uncharacterized protein n=2 Tax=Cyanophyceae TaxID=3028117 RepID=A0A4Q7E901_9CYAN|nr:hypothetical protein [Leptolyngbya sp. LK]RZM79001.1 hypothetical protein DYY88_09515 [Leptolyngbya sp. LK]
MTGFIRGLFGRKNSQSAAAQPKQTGAFFLSEDDAKTFGDIDYMRSSKVVKRTFARKKGQEELESVRQISAMGMRELDEKGLPSQESSNNGASSFEAAKSTSSSSDFQRRTAKTDTSMDMFRNMAKDIKKR